MGNGTFKSLKKIYYFYTYYIFDFIKIFKPGIIFGNIIALISGFLLASKGQIKYSVLIKSIISMICIISSACIINNILDKDIDQCMNRTKKRILCIFGDNIYLIYFLWFLSFFLCFIGCIIFYVYINILCIVISLIGFFIYILLYSYICKRKYFYSTIIGSISGALPPIVGYIAIKNTFDICCIIIFFMYSFWQISHFYSISIFRLNDYKNAGIPLFSVIYGVKKTKININLCIIFLIFSNFLLYLLNYVNVTYLWFTTFFLSFWYFFSIFGGLFFNNIVWSRIMFFISIFVIFIVFFFMFFNFYFY
ncbi:protoheme IX farnesyltransferase [Buchnera aphidicola (Cinara tujafilina)]|uniref:Protoheme IX farnesyltransferase n=1 Tax=Buchnera aphidicola (Cinara tujafilina) TaxID=261317 RepID=F7WZK6_9GAMM|nr:protoheme IX farnesyltransferase [Buchnera aphidicola]AEH39873.1 protoheme IX farnesyltransferase [Buchnera aphidicola (Cinara tujafilina)]